MRIKNMSRLSAGRRKPHREKALKFFTHNADKYTQWQDQHTKLRDISMKIETELGFDQGTLFSASPTNELQAAADSAALSMETAQADTPVAQSRPRNLLENNFFNDDYESSKYVLGTLSGLRTENQFRDKMNGIVELYKLGANNAGPAAGGVDNYAEKTLAGKKAARATGEAVEGKVSESETKRMEREREEAKEEEENRITEETSGDSEETVASETSAGESRGEATIAQNAAADDAETTKERVEAAAAVSGNSQQTTSAAQQEETSRGSQNTARAHVNIVV